MVSRRTNFGERSEPAPDRGGKLQSAGGGGGGGGGLGWAAQSDVSPLHPVQLVCCPLLHAILSPDPITRQHIMSDEDNLLLCVSQVQDMLEL